MCFGGGNTTVEAPQPSAEERALQAQQAQSLQLQNQLLQQQQEAAAMQREQYSRQLHEQQRRQRGLADAWDQYMQGPEVAAQKEMYAKQQEVYDLELERYEKALSGQLPISEGTRQAEAEARGTMESSLSRRLGKNWRNSTSGIQSLAAFEKRWDAAKSAEQHGYLQLGAQTALSRAGLAGQEQGQAWNQYMQGRGLEADLFGNLFNQSGVANQFGYGEGLAGLGQLQQGYSNAMQPYQYYNNMAYQANAQTAANQSANQAGLFGMFGNVLGMGLGAYSAFA